MLYGGEVERFEPGLLDLQHSYDLAGLLAYQRSGEQALAGENRFMRGVGNDEDLPAAEDGLEQRRGRLAPASRTEPFSRNTENLRGARTARTRSTIPTSTSPISCRSMDREAR